MLYIKQHGKIDVILRIHLGDYTGGNPEAITMKATFDIFEKEELEE